MHNQVVISTEVRHLPEVGEAWLVDEAGTPIAKFYNGQLMTGTVNQGNHEEETITAAA